MKMLRGRVVARSHTPRSVRYRVDDVINSNFLRLIEKSYFEDFFYRKKIAHHTKVLQQH